MNWWVIQRNSGLPRDPGQQAYVAIQAADRTAATAYGTAGAGGTVAAGPFLSQADANNWIDTQAGLAPGTKPTLANQAAAAKGPVSIPSPLSGLAAIGDFFSRLGRANTWIRAGEVLAGLILLAVGVAKLTRAVPIATKIAGAIE